MLRQHYSFFSEPFLISSNLCNCTQDLKYSILGQGDWEYGILTALDTFELCQIGVLAGYVGEILGALVDNIYQILNGSSIASVVTCTS